MGKINNPMLASELGPTAFDALERYVDDLNREEVEAGFGPDDVSLDEDQVLTSIHRLPDGQIRLEVWWAAGGSELGAFRWIPPRGWLREDEVPGRFVVVYLNDARVIGPFGTRGAADAWARKVPNKLFDTEEQLEHADTNSDFYVTELEEA
jgi:hypothetical protein